MTFVSRVIAAVGRLVTQPYGSCPACGKKGPNLHVAHRMPLALVELDEEQRNLKLGGEVTDEMMDFLNPLEDDVAFVNLAAFTLCKHTLRKQAMLEVSTLGKRANMLLDDLLRENERLALLRKAIGDIPSEDFDSN